MILDWRDNIHKTLKSYFPDWERNLPIMVENAIDAAYIARMDDAKSELKRKLEGEKKSERWGEEFSRTRGEAVGWNNAVNQILSLLEG